MQGAALEAKYGVRAPHIMPLIAADGTRSPDCPELWVRRYLLGTERSETLYRCAWYGLFAAPDDRSARRCHDIEIVNYMLDFVTMPFDDAVREMQLNVNIVWAACFSSNPVGVRVWAEMCHRPVLAHIGPMETLVDDICTQKYENQRFPAGCAVWTQHSPLETTILRTACMRMHILERMIAGMWNGFYAAGTRMVPTQPHPPGGTPPGETMLPPVREPLQPLQFEAPPPLSISEIEQASTMLRLRLEVWNVAVPVVVRKLRMEAVRKMWHLWDSHMPLEIIAYNTHHLLDVELRNPAEPPCVYEALRPDAAKTFCFRNMPDDIKLLGDIGLLVHPRSGSGGEGVGAGNTYAALLIKASNAPCALRSFREKLDKMMRDDPDVVPHVATKVVCTLLGCAPHATAFAPPAIRRQVHEHFIVRRWPTRRMISWLVANSLFVRYALREYIVAGVPILRCLHHTLTQRQPWERYSGLIIWASNYMRRHAAAMLDTHGAEGAWLMDTAPLGWSMRPISMALLSTPHTPNGTALPRTVMMLHARPLRRSRAVVTQGARRRSRVLARPAHNGRRTSSVVDYMQATQRTFSLGDFLTRTDAQALKMASRPPRGTFEENMARAVEKVDALRASSQQMTCGRVVLPEPLAVEQRELLRTIVDAIANQPTGPPDYKWLQLLGVTTASIIAVTTAHQRFAQTRKTMPIKALMALPRSDYTVLRELFIMLHVAKSVRLWGLPARYYCAQVLALRRAFGLATHEAADASLPDAAGRVYLCPSCGSIKPITGIRARVCDPFSAEYGHNRSCAVGPTDVLLDIEGGPDYDQLVLRCTRALSKKSAAARAAEEASERVSTMYELGIDEELLDNVLALDDYDDDGGDDDDDDDGGVDVAGATVADSDLQAARMAIVRIAEDNRRARRATDPVGTMDQPAPQPPPTLSLPHSRSALVAQRASNVVTSGLMRFEMRLLKGMRCLRECREQPLIGVNLIGVIMEFFGVLVMICPCCTQLFRVRTHFRYGDTLMCYTCSDMLRQRLTGADAVPPPGIAAAKHTHRRRAGTVPPAAGGRQRATHAAHASGVSAIYHTSTRGRPNAMFGEAAGREISCLRCELGIAEHASGVVDMLVYDDVGTAGGGVVTLHMCARCARSATVDTRTILKLSTLNGRLAATTAVLDYTEELSLVDDLAHDLGPLTGTSRRRAAAGGGRRRTRAVRRRTDDTPTAAADHGDDDEAVAALSEGSHDIAARGEVSE